MGAWQQTRQNTRMRRIGDRAWRECLREANSLLRQLIQRRSLHAVVPITMNVVRAQRIDSDQKNVLAGCLVRRRLAGCAVPECQEATDEDEKDPHSVERTTARALDIRP